MNDTVQIFVSYSHKDPDYLSEGSLLGFLKGLEEEAGVTFWNDERLAAGVDWDDEIKTKMRSSQIALVLVSQSFLDSAYCRNVEMAEFLARCRRDGLVIFPVILSPCEWERHEWLASRQFLPGANETIEEHYLDPGSRKRLFLRIRKELRSTIERVRLARAEAPAVEAPKAQAERRQLTVVRCDLVPSEKGGEPLDEEDLPEVLHELMPEFQQVCTGVAARFEGYVAQRAGSGIAIYFGLHVAHEDDSRRAVRAGAEILRTVSELSPRFEEELSVRLSARVGVHTGWVVGTIGGGDAQDALTQGETPAIAGHLQGLAPIGSLVISEATHKMVDGFFESRDLGPATLPGIRQQVRVFEIVGDSGAQTRFQAALRKGLSPLVGREQELGLLMEKWAAAKAGSGQIVMLSAEAGVGKSRLLAEIKSRTALVSTIVECHCSPNHQNSALYPVIQLLESWVRLDRTDSDEQKLRKLEPVVRRFEDSRGENAALLASLLSIPFEHRYPRIELDPKEQKQRTLELLAAILVESAIEKPVLLVIEDLHWIDPSTLEWLDLVVEQVPTVPLLALFAFRPEFSPPAAWQKHARTCQITLGRLGREQVAEMVDQITAGKALPAEVFEDLCRKTEGFPLFVEDLTRAVLESDLLIERDGGYQLAEPFHSLAIPDTLQEALLARLGRLETARQVAQIGAVIGREFVYEMVQAVAALDDETLKEELNRLVSAGLLYRRGLLSRARYIFKHALIQEALHQSLLKRQRKHFHLVVAKVLEERFPEIRQTQPELLAHHYTEAGAPEQAIDYWIEAGQQAGRRSANLEALGHAGRGLEVLAALPEGAERDRRALLIETLRGPAFLALKGWASPELGDCYSRARELCHRVGRTPKLFQVTRGIWTHHMVSAKLGAALDLAQDLLEVAETEQSEDLLLEAHAAFCDTLFWTGDPGASREHGRRGLELYDSGRHHQEHSVLYGEDPATMFYSYSALSLWLLGFPEQSLRFTAEAVRVVDLWTHAFSRCFLLCGIAWNHVQLRQAAEAGVYSQRLLELAGAHHFEVWLAIGTTMQGWARAEQGQIEEGLSLMTQGRERWHATGAAVKASFYPFLIADTHRRAGRWEDGLRWVATGLEAAGGCEDRYYLSELHRLRGDLLLAAGAAAAEIEECYRQAGEIARGQGARALELRVAMSRARFLERGGELPQARQELAEIYGRFSEGLETADLAEARQLLRRLG